MKVLSIQSAVAYGHVGNSAAVFPLQRIGVEVLPVNTVNFSNHTGYGAWRGPMISPDDVRDVITGIEERGVLGETAVHPGRSLQRGGGLRLVERCAVRHVGERHAPKAESGRLVPACGARVLPALQAEVEGAMERIT